MPKLIDWGVRFDLMREAIVRIAVRDGARAVSLASVAAELKLHPATLRRSVSGPDVLPRMGVAHIAHQRARRIRWHSRPAAVEYASVEHVSWVLRALLPADEEEVQLERAWRELTSIDMDEARVKLCQEHDETLDTLIRRSLVTLGTEPTSREDQVIQLRAVIDGLVAARCRDGITPEQAVECLKANLHALPLVPELRAREPAPAFTVAGERSGRGAG